MTAVKQRILHSQSSSTWRICIVVLLYFINTHGVQDDAMHETSLAERLGISQCPSLHEPPEGTEATLGALGRLSL